MARSRERARGILAPPLWKRGTFQSAYGGLGHSTHDSARCALNRDTFVPGSDTGGGGGAAAAATCRCAP
jgi:hypothetical protein